MTNIVRKVDDVDKALLNSGAKVTNSVREKTSKLLSIEKNRLVAIQARSLSILPLRIFPPVMLSIFVSGPLLQPQFTLSIFL